MRLLLEWVVFAVIMGLVLVSIPFNWTGLIILLIAAFLFCPSS